MMHCLSTRDTVLQALIDEVHAPKLLPYIHAVYGVSGEPETLGSSVLLRRRQQLYLATAAHVLEENDPTPQRDATSLYLSGNDGQLHLLEAECLRNTEPADLTVAPLLGVLAEDWDLYPALDIDSQVAPGETSGLHLLLGYPIRRAAFNLDQARHVVQHRAYKYTQVRTAHKDDGEHHFSLIMERDHVRCGNDDQTAPFPRVVSGGSVFCLTGSRPMLAGILIAYVRGTRLVATKANRLYALLNA